MKIAGQQLRIGREQVKQEGCVLISISSEGKEIPAITL
jgi:hypothetical protein